MRRLGSRSARHVNVVSRAATDPGDGTTLAGTDTIALPWGAGMVPTTSPHPFSPFRGGSVCKTSCC